MLTNSDIATVYIDRCFIYINTKSHTMDDAWDNFYYAREREK